jgi:hypothetical protein
MLPTEIALADSPCCNRKFELLPLGKLEIFHYRCAECRLLYVWNGHQFIPCQQPQKHLTDSRSVAPLFAYACNASATTENEGRSRARL